MWLLFSCSAHIRFFFPLCLGEIQRTFLLKIFWCIVLNIVGWMNFVESWWRFWKVNQLGILIEWYVGFHILKFNNILSQQYLSNLNNLISSLNSCHQGPSIIQIIKKYYFFNAFLSSTSHQNPSRSLSLWNSIKFHVMIPFGEENSKTRSKAISNGGNNKCIWKLWLGVYGCMHQGSSIFLMLSLSIMIWEGIVVIKEMEY